MGDYIVPYHELLENEQNTLNDESLNTSHLSSNSRRKGKGVSEEREGKRWSEDGAGFVYLRSLGRGWSHLV